MKKLLVLMLVLGMASTASAVALTLTQPDLSIPVVKVSGDLDQDLYILLVGDGTLINFAKGGDAPDLSPPTLAGPANPDLAGLFPALSPASKAYTGEYWGMATSDLAVYPIMGGDYLSAEGVVGDWVYAMWFDEVNFTPNVIGEYQIVPEPMTVALLGLGSLFLLRRRK